jgi:hypothetical protein
MEELYLDIMVSKTFKCPYCKSDKVKEGSDFYMCNNPHCLHIWVKNKKVRGKKK